MNSTIRDVLARYGNLSVEVSTLSDFDDLGKAGLASHATINIMLALEDEFDVEFSDDLMNRSTFSTIDSIASAIASLTTVTS